MINYRNKIHFITFAHIMCEWRLRDSNSWPPACKAGALPTELNPHNKLYLIKSAYLKQWAQVDSNHRPHAYQACALTCWAMSPYGIWQPLTFPGSFPPSIISRLCLNQPVRNGKGCVPQTHHHQKFLKAFFIPSKLNIEYHHLSSFVNTLLTELY